MKLKTILGTTVLGFTVILLTLSGTITQAQLSSSQYKSNINVVIPIYIEEMNIIAGNDAAALVELILVGEGAPSIASDPLFANVENWLFIASDQADYLPYLDRRPLKSPDNATLIVEIDGALGEAGSLAEALDIAMLFAAYYDVVLYWARAEKLGNNNYLYYFTGGMEETIFTTLITEIQTDVGTGFASLLSASVVSAAPVKAVVIGEGLVEAEIRPVRGVFYVDDTAITGTDKYVLATENLFGANVVAKNNIPLSVSTLKFKFPYTINTLAITPDTDNFAPHITGKMDWLLDSPWMGPPRPASNYNVTYEINNAALTSSPRVSVNMAYDQDMLNIGGRLQMDYEVKNTGTENATDIVISYQVGEDIVSLINDDITMPAIRDDVYLDESAHIEFDATINIDVTETLEDVLSDTYYNQIVLVLDGWYRWVANDSLVDFMPGITSAEVREQTQSVVYGMYSGDIITSINVHSASNLSRILVSTATSFLAPIDIIDYISNPSALYAAYETELWNSISDAGNQLYDLIYENKPIFNQDLLNFTLEQIPVGVIDSVIQYDNYLTTTIPSLEVGEIANVSWAIDDIPSTAIEFGAMGFALIDVGATYEAIHMRTVLKNGYDLMRLIFGIGDPGLTFTYSRPLSFYNVWDNDWYSVGARYSYLDEQGFEYYGFSNGINLQLADDEAVLNVHVSLDYVSYVVGAPVEVTYTVENTGNIAAENVEIYLFHGRMGNDWQIRNAELFWYDNVGSIAAGATYSDTAEVFANSFLGIHPVYAVAEFDSDVGQTPIPDGVVDFGNGIVTVFEGAAETHHFVLSNMDWAMLLPSTEDREPAFPQPILSIDVTALFIIPDAAPWELEITIVITNVGDASTTITVYQVYNATDMELKWKTSTKGSTYNETVYGMGFITFSGITLAPGESVTIVMHWLFLYSLGCYIPGIRIIYDSRFENDMDDPLGEESEASTAVMNAMNGQSQDNEDWEDYGQSTQTGSSAGVDSYPGGESERRFPIEYVYYAAGAIGGIILIAIVISLIRKRAKR